MAVYIEKQAAIDNIEKSFDKETILNRFVRKIAISAVRRMEPADVRPVVRSHWKKNDNGTYSCERCHSWIPEDQWHYANWCLYCGADMKEGKK